MSESTQFMFSHREVVTALVRQQGLHEGIWALAIQFGFAASNVGPTKTDLNPAAVSAVHSIGLQRAVEESNMTVDAAVVNPAPKAARAATATSKGKSK